MPVARRMPDAPNPAANRSCPACRVRRASDPSCRAWRGFFREADTILADRGLKRLDGMPRPAAMSGTVSGMVTASLARRSGTPAENRFRNGRPGLAARGACPNDAVRSGTDGRTGPPRRREPRQRRAGRSRRAPPFPSRVVPRCGCCGARRIRPRGAAGALAASCGRCRRARAPSCPGSPPCRSREPGRACIRLRNDWPPHGRGKARARCRPRLRRCGPSRRPRSFRRRSPQHAGLPDVPCRRLTGLPVLHPGSRFPAGRPAARAFSSAPGMAAASSGASPSRRGFPGALRMPDRPPDATQQQAVRAAGPSKCDSSI